MANGYLDINSVVVSFNFIGTKCNKILTECPNLTNTPYILAMKSMYAHFSEF